MSRRIPRTLASVVAPLLAVWLVSGCTDDGPSAERFCGEVDANKAALTAPSLAYDDDIAAVLDLYRDIGTVAPLAIEDAWDQLVLNYETASTVVPGDAESVQRAVTMAYQSERSAVEVSEWLAANCNVYLGPLATLVPQP
jgi:hypothetical protein